MNRGPPRESPSVGPRPLASGGAGSLDEQAAGKLLDRYAVSEPDDLTVERVWHRLANPAPSFGASRKLVGMWVMAPAVLAWVLLLGFILVRGPARRVHPQASAPVAASPSAELGAVRGAVFFSRPAEHWQPGRAGQALAESERLRSDPNSLAVLEVPRVASVLIASGTDLAIDRLNAGTFLRLSRGSVVARVSKRPPSEPFVVLTDRFAVKVVGTLFRVDQDGNGRTAVAVREGIVEVAAVDGKSWRVEAGQRWVSSEPEQRGLADIGDRVKALLEDGLRGTSSSQLEGDLEAVGRVPAVAMAGEASPATVPAGGGGVLEEVDRRAELTNPPQVAANGRGTRALAALDRSRSLDAPAPSASAAKLAVAPPVLLAEREPIAVEARPMPSEQAAPAPVTAAGPAGAVDGAYLKGLALERRGQLGAAAAELTRADGEDPSHADLALYALGRLYQHRLNNPHGALDAFERYRSRYPQGALLPEVDLAVLEVEVQTGDRKEALAESMRFLASHPASERSDEVRLLRGNLFREGGDCRTALGEYAEVAAPAFAEPALYGTARCQLKLGEAEVARETLRSYQKRFPAGPHRDEVAKVLAEESAKHF